MGHTDAWDESTPLGTENASTADNYLRNHRRDLGERLEEMFCGFNASDNSGAENEVGVKHLKMYKQTSDPTAVTDYGHFYVKLVDGVPELFWQDDENTTIQLTSGGKILGGSLKDDSVDEDAIRLDNDSYLTGRNAADDDDVDIIKVNTDDVPEVLVGAVLSADTAPVSDPAIANKKYVDDSQKPTCRLYLGTKQTQIGTSGKVIEVDTDSSNFDTDETDTANYKITPGVAGFYLIVGAIRFSDCGSAEIMNCGIYKNGSDIIALQKGQSAGTANKSVQCVTVAYLDADDYVQLWGFASSAGYDAENGEAKTYLEVARLR